VLGKRRSMSTNTCCLGRRRMLAASRTIVYTTHHAYSSLFRLLSYDHYMATRHTGLSQAKPLHIAALLAATDDHIGGVLELVDSFL
jgi:hypothetical protein